MIRAAVLGILAATMLALPSAATLLVGCDHLASLWRVAPPHLRPPNKLTPQKKISCPWGPFGRVVGGVPDHPPSSRSHKALVGGGVSQTSPLGVRPENTPPRPPSHRSKIQVFRTKIVLKKFLRRFAP